MSRQQSGVRKQGNQPIYRSLVIREPDNHNKMSNVTEDALRGSSLAALVEEPMQNVGDFLEGHPDAQSVSNVLSLYKAYVVQLAEYADNMTPTEMAWRQDIPVERAQIARQKFEELENGGERIADVLDSYREAIKRLERTMKRLVVERQSYGGAQVITPRAGRSAEPADGGIIKMMSTGLDMLFGRESYDSCDLDAESQPGTSTQCYSESETEWSGAKGNKTEPYSQDESCEVNFLPSTPDRTQSAVAVFSRSVRQDNNTSIVPTNAPPDNMYYPVDVTTGSGLASARSDAHSAMSNSKDPHSPSDDRAAREARRRAREFKGEFIQNVPPPFVPLLELSPPRGYSSKQPLHTRAQSPQYSLPSSAFSAVSPCHPTCNPCPLCVPCHPCNPGGHTVSPQPGVSGKSVRADYKEGLYYSEPETRSVREINRDNAVSRVTCSSHSSSPTRTAELVYPAISPPHTSGTCSVATTKKTTERQIISRYPSPRSPQQLSYGHSHPPQHSLTTSSTCPSRYPDSPSGRQGLIESLSKEVERMVDSVTPSLPADTTKSMGGHTGRSTVMAADVTHYSFETPESEISSKISTSTDINTEIRRIKNELTNLAKDCPTCRRLSTEKATLEIQLDEARKKMKEKSAEVHRLQTRLSLASEQHPDLKSGHEQQPEQKLERQIQEKNDAITRMQSMEKQIEQLRQEKDQLNNENISIRMELHEVKQEKNYLNERVRSLESGKQEAQQQKQALCDQIKSLQNELSAYVSGRRKEILDMPTADQKRIELENQQLRQEIRHWRESGEQYTKELHAAQQKIDQLYKEGAVGQAKQHERVSHSQTDSSSTCEECRQKISPQRLEPLVNYAHRWCDADKIMSQSGCQECKEKEVELTRLSQQLTSLYKQTIARSGKLYKSPPTGSNIPNYQPDPNTIEIEKLRREVSRLTKELQSMSKIMEQQQQASESPSPKLSSKHSGKRLEQLSQENQNLQSELTQVQDERSQLQFDNGKLNSKIKELSLEKAKLQEKVIREDNPGLISQINQLEEENRLLKDTISGLQRRNVSQGEKESLLVKEKDLEINHLSAKIESLKNEVHKLKASNNAELHKLAAEEKHLYEKENERLRRLSVELQEEIDSLKESLRKESIEPEFLREKTQMLKELEGEVKHLRKLKAEFDSGNERTELKEAEIKKLQNELRLAKQDIELYHKGLGPNSKTAYIVRMRDQQIIKLQENLAEMERIIAQLTERSPQITTKKKGKGHHIDLPPAPKQENESEMLLLMAEDTTRLKQKLHHLEQDNKTLVSKIRERDAKMYEMQTEIDWLVKGTNQQELITNYTQKLRSGEEEMGRLHQKMEVITQRHSTLLLAKENEILEVRTHYAKQLSQLINDCVSRNENQESEMKNLCNELDNQEKRNFELERLVREYENAKTEQIPKLRKDLDALRMSKNELRSEFEQTNRRMKDLQKDLQIAQKEKLDLEKLHESHVAKLKSEVENTKRDLRLKEDKHKSALNHKDSELNRLKLELNNVAATVQERDGSVTHWKIKCEDINRQIRDLEERNAIAIKAKDTEIKSLNGQIGELIKSVDNASAINEKELFRVQSQFRELQRQHLDILEQNDANVKLKEDEMKRLYSEIGEISAHLHTATKEKDQEIHRLRNDLKRQRAEKDSFLVECSNTIQEKQAEIRKLMADIEQLEVEAARFHALKEQELAGVKSDYQVKMDQLSSDRAHLLAIKDSEIQTLSAEIERLMNDVKDGGYSIVDMKKRIFQLEQDKNELLLLKDQWQADMDKLFSEFEQCKEDKQEFEEMVERMSREMEERIEGMKSDHKNALEIKDNHIRDLYGKVEKIAKDRGDMSAHLHNVLQEKEQKVEELFEKLKEYDACLDQAEKDFKNKLQRKSQEVKWLRGEIRKMGDEGVRLLDMREREITEMRTHLKNILRVMEHKQKQKASSHIIITRPQFVQPVEPHLKAADTSKKTASKPKTVSNRRLRR